MLCNGAFLKILSIIRWMFTWTIILNRCNDQNYAFWGTKRCKEKTYNKTLTKTLLIPAERNAAFIVWCLEEGPQQTIMLLKLKYRRKSKKEDCSGVARLFTGISFLRERGCFVCRRWVKWIKKFEEIMDLCVSEDVGGKRLIGDNVWDTG